MYKCWQCEKKYETRISQCNDCGCRIFTKTRLKVPKKVLAR